MAEYIEREAASKMYDGIPMWGSVAQMMLDCIPAADVVSRAAFDQVMWERDTAMEQLEEHGIPFGGKADVVAVVRCKDCKYYVKAAPTIEAIVLPCKVGDFVWLVFTPKHPANPADKGKWFMVRDGVQRIIWGAKGISIETWNMGTIPEKEVGKKLFFTSEEAETALAKMDGGDAG